MPANNAHSMSGMPTVLQNIVAARRTHLPAIAERIAHVDPAALPKSTRSLYDSLNHGRGGARFIMECKSASPSLGTIRAFYQPGDIARIYSRYAAGISVLCEPERFGGDYDHLATVAASTHLPVLCKDFIIDPVQIHAARYFGADAILLMLSVLDDATYAELAAEAARLGLDVLTEVVDEEEVARAIALGAKIMGVNHRDLHDLSIDLSRSARLAPLIPEDAVFIAESGIRSHDVVEEISGYVNGFLVGSQLTGSPDIDRAVRELLYGTVKVCGLSTISAAQVSRAAGATYGGLIFEAASPRAVTVEQAQAIIAAEPGLDYVAVSRRSAGYEELCLPGIAAVQVHAPTLATPEEECALVAAVRESLPDSVAVWRAVRMDEHAPAIIAALQEQGIAEKLVLDAGDGGTGRPFDWSLLEGVNTQNCLLAGGLNPDNIEQALALRCGGVDLNSGVEVAITPADDPYANGPSGRKVRKDAAKVVATLEKIRMFHVKHSSKENE